MSKYGSIKTGKYASKREAKRAQELRFMEKSGVIRDLREQVRYELLPAFRLDGKCVERAVTYVADFVYEEGRQPGLPEYSAVLWFPVVEDSKGMKTRDYIIKRKLMLFRHGIRIWETK